MRTDAIGLNSPDKTVWWMVDLGRSYNIYSVNILFKNYTEYGTNLLIIYHNKNMVVFFIPFIITLWTYWKVTNNHKYTAIKYIFACTCILIILIRMSMTEAKRIDMLRPIDLNILVQFVVQINVSMEVKKEGIKRLIRLSVF